MKISSSGFDFFYWKNVSPFEETISSVILNKIQDENKVILNEPETFCKPTPKLHNDIDTPLPTAKKRNQKLQD